MKIVYLILVLPAFLFLNACESTMDNNPPPDPIDTTSVTDIDGNVYQTIIIGSQCWMVENLKVTRYRNGDPIPNITNNSTWMGLLTGAYCNYNNDTSNTNTYGMLYNWHAAADSRNIAPLGWHVPNDSDLTILENYLGGSLVAAGKMKVTSFNVPVWDGNNSSGFKLLPTGYRECADGSFGYIGSCTMLWSTTEFNSDDAWERDIYSGTDESYRNSIDKNMGFSIRCVKD